MGAGPDVDVILLVIEGVLALAGLIAMVVASWIPDRCGTPGCDFALGVLASRLWVAGTIAVLVLSIVVTVVCRTRRVNAWWAPATGIVLIIGINVAAQVMTGSRRRTDGSRRTRRARPRAMRGRARCG